MVAEPVEIHLDQAGFAVETEKLVVFQFRAGLVHHERFGDDPRRDVLVGPFAPGPVVVPFEAGRQFPAGGALVEAAFVPADDRAVRVVGAFQHELLRQTGPIHVLDPVPNAQQREQMPLADLIGDEFAHFVFVDPPGLLRPAAAQLEPLQLFVERPRRIEFQPLAHQDPVADADVELVRDELEMAVEPQIEENQRGTPHVLQDFRPRDPARRIHGTASAPSRSRAMAATSARQQRS